MAVFGHSGSQAPQLMHSLVITVATGGAIPWRAGAFKRAGRWKEPMIGGANDPISNPARPDPRLLARGPRGARRGASGHARRPAGARERAPAPAGGGSRIRRPPGEGGRTREPGAGADPSRPRVGRRNREAGGAARARPPAPRATPREAHRGDEAARAEDGPALEDARYGRWPSTSSSTRGSAERAGRPRAE